MNQAAADGAGAPGPRGSLFARRGPAGFALGLIGDTPSVIVAVALAGLTLVLAIAGLALPINGGFLRYTPYASLLLAPATAAALVLSPWSGMCMWILLMPVMNIAQVQIVAGPEQVILTSALLVALVVGRLLDARRSGARLRPDRLTAVVWCLSAVAIAMSLVSTALAPSLTRSLPIVQHGLVEPLVLLDAVLWLRPARSQVALLLPVMGASVAIGAGLSLVRMWLRYAQTIDEFAAQRIQLARLVYFNVGILGDMIAMALPLLVAWLLLRRQQRWPAITTLVATVAMAVSAACLYLTFSKSGWLGRIVASAFILVLVLRRWPAKVAVVVVAAALTAFVIPYPSVILNALSPSVATAFGNVVQSVDSRAVSINPASPEGEVSVTERIYATKAALAMAADHPLFGVGAGQFADEYAHAYHVAGATRALDSAHDFLPYVAAELGLIVAGILALGLAAAFLAALLAFRRAPADDRVARVMSAAVAAALAGFVIVSTTFGLDLYRAYRTMDSDVLYGALLVAIGLMLPRILRTQPGE